MPTYEYACRDCGEHLEVVQSFKDDPLTECGRCGGTLRKVFSAAGIIFKGSGYYVTDSRAASAKSPDSSPDTSPDKGSGDATPAAAKDSGTGGAAPGSDSGSASPSKPSSGSSGTTAKSA